MNRTKSDARFLTRSAQEDLRQRVVRAIQDGMRKAEAARVFGVSRQAIHNWLKRAEKGGFKALKARPRGRPRVSRLAPHQAALAVRLIIGRCPDQLRLPFGLWTREAVQMMLERRFGLQVSVWTVGRYLRRWEMTPQKPLRRAFEQNPEAVRHWLETEYPAIRQLAKQEGAEIYWGDEMGLRSDHQAGRSYGRRGRTPVIPGTGQRFRCNVVSALTNRGKLAFMVFTQNMTQEVFLEFLRRLVRQVKRKIFLILDRLQVHRGAKVLRWLTRQEGKIRFFYLPSCSPELNPDELLNQDVKTNSLGRRRPRDPEELIGTVRSYLRSTQKRPDIVRNYFNEEHVLYAAA